MSEQFVSSRRDFLRLVPRVAAGVAIGVAQFPVGAVIDAAVETTTGHPTDRSSKTAGPEATCEDSRTEEACPSITGFSNAEKFQMIVKDPIVEELTFRGLPSALVGETDSGHDDYLIFGTRRLVPTRREALVGLLSSVGFALRHNIREDGVDTNTIPSSQFVGGIFLWGTARSLGLPTSIALHATHNAIAVNI